MADSTFETLELRFRFEPHWTEAYVLCGPTSDGMLGVQGWHKKQFPPEVSAVDILLGDIAQMQYLTEWDDGAPPD